MPKGIFFSFPPPPSTCMRYNLLCPIPSVLSVHYSGLGAGKFCYFVTVFIAVNAQLKNMDLTQNLMKVLVLAIYSG